jgi:DNA-binding MltR family transcriptional regulator
MERRKLIEYIVSNDTDYKFADLNIFSFEQLTALKETVELRNLNSFSMKAMDAIFNSVSLI